MKIFITLLLIFAVSSVALTLWARLAPIDPALWHQDISSPEFVSPGANGAGFCPTPGGRYVLAPDDLAALDRVAMNWPHTNWLAGSVASGHISWVTRSAVIGFPDITTAQVLGEGDTARICVIARQRIGSSDLGVNGRRLREWLAATMQLDEAPDLVWQPPG